MIPIFLVALALTGAPSTTHMICDPNLPYEGLTFFGPPPVIFVDPMVCRGLTLAWSKGETILTDYQRFVVALGMLTILHEATHASGVRDETDAQCNAIRLLPFLAASYLNKRNIPSVMSHAREDGRALPSEYHAHPC